MECYTDDTIRQSASAASIINYCWKPRDDFTAPRKKADKRGEEIPTITETAIVEIQDPPNSSETPMPEAVAALSRTDDGEPNQSNTVNTIIQHLRSMVDQLEESTLSYGRQCDYIQRHFDEVPHQPDDDDARFQKWTKDIQRQPTSTADHVKALLGSGEQRKKLLRKGGEHGYVGGRSRGELGHKQR